MLYSFIGELIPYRNALEIQRAATGEKNNCEQAAQFFHNSHLIRLIQQKSTQYSETWLAIGPSSLAWLSAALATTLAWFLCLCEAVIESYSCMWNTVHSSNSSYWTKISSFWKKE